jgi:hypothetical protein
MQISGLVTITLAVPTLVALLVGCDDGLRTTDAGRAANGQRAEQEVEKTPGRRARSAERATESFGQAPARMAPPARIDDTAVQRAPAVTRAQRLTRPRHRETHPVTVSMGGDRHIRNRLAEATVAEAIAILEQTMGPLEGAHYVLQPGSALELADGEWIPLDGGFSLIDCRDPELAAREPDRGFDYWIGGLLLSSSPEILQPAGHGNVHLPLFGGPGMSERLGWGSLRIRGTRPIALNRTLALELDREERDWARVVRRHLQLDAEAENVARFDGDRAACPEWLSLSLLLKDGVIEWEAGVEEGEEDMGVRSRPIAGSQTTELLGSVTLELMRVSYEPEIFDPDQRLPRLASAAQSELGSRATRRVEGPPLRVAPVRRQTGGVLKGR